MKILQFLIVFYFFFPVILSAQPAITADNFPRIGTTYAQKTFAITSIQPGDGGTNQNWDFSSLQIPASAQPVILSFVNPAGTPYQSQFPEANITSKYQNPDGTFSYGYFKTSASQLSMLGAATGEGKEVYKNANLMAKVPMTFSQESTSAYNGTMENSAFLAFIDARKTMRYDGFGTLKLPSKTWPNAMRTITVENRTDSVGFGNSMYTKNVTKTSLYAWFVTGVTNAIFEIRIVEQRSITYVPGAPISEQTNPIRRIVSIQNNPLSAVSTPTLRPNTFDVKLVSANPLHEGSARFEVSSEIKKEINVLLINTLGQILSSQHIEIAAGLLLFDLNLSGHTAGVYYIFFSDGLGVISLPVVHP